MLLMIRVVQLYSCVLFELKSALTILLVKGNEQKLETKYANERIKNYPIFYSSKP